MKRNTWLLLTTLALELSATTYYVDTAGDDAAAGTSPATAWKTPARAFKTVLGPGDQVLFRAGRVWRIDGTLSVHAQGSEAHPVVVSSYGSGAQPEFRASLDGTQPGFWTSAGNGLWTAKVSGKTDVGNIVRAAKGGLHVPRGCGWKRWKREDLRQEGDYFHDLAQGVVWYRGEVDPAAAHDQMELCRKICILGVGGTQWLRVEGLSLSYTGAHGIVGAPVQHLRVHDCTFGWIGGSKLADWPDGHGGTYPVRYGNGIEFWATGHNYDIRLDGNHFYEVYDTAMTNQGNCDGVLEKMVICSNRTERCEQSYEIWFTSTNYLVKSIELFGNRFEDAGFGWSHAQRPNKNATHLLAYGFKPKVESIYYHDNYFGRTKQCMFWWFSWPAIKHVRLDHNTYVQPGIDAESWHGLFHWRGEERPCQPTWEDYRRLTGHDAHSKLLTPRETDVAAWSELQKQARGWLALPNGDFEEPAANFSGAFAGWTVTEPKLGPHCRALADAKVKHGGAYSLYLEAAPHERIQVARNADLHDHAFKPGRTYRVSCAMRRKPGCPPWSFDFGVYTRKLQGLYTHHFKVDAEEWKLVSDAFELPGGGHILRFMFNAASGAAGWVDDLRLEEQLEDGTWREVISAGY